VTHVNSNNEQQHTAIMTTRIVIKTRRYAPRRLTGADAEYLISRLRRTRVHSADTTDLIKYLLSTSPY